MRGGDVDPDIGRGFVDLEAAGEAVQRRERDLTGDEIGGAEPAVRRSERAFALARFRIVQQQDALACA